MLYNDYEEYMQNVLGYSINPNNTYQPYNMYSHYNNDYCNQFQPLQPQYEASNLNCNIEKMYPEIYKTIQPMVCRMCQNINQPITEEIIEKMTNEIYKNVEKCKENRETKETRAPQRENSLLRDLIRILILNQLLNQHRPPFTQKNPKFTNLHYAYK